MRKCVNYSGTFRPDWEFWVNAIPSAGAKSADKMGILCSAVNPCNFKRSLVDSHMHLVTLREKNET